MGGSISPRWFKMSTFFLILYIIIAIWAIISISGFLVYKAEVASEVHSWEDGVKKVMTFVFEFVYEEILGKILPDKLINPALMCSNKEVLQLVERFSNHPYDTPALNSYIPNVNGIDWYDFAAVGLISKYKNLSNREIAKIADHIIQTFFMETRNCKVPLFIKVAAPTRLYFAVALSENGRKFLEKQNLPMPMGDLEKARSLDIPTETAGLEEVIELFPKQDSEDDL